MQIRANERDRRTVSDPWSTPPTKFNEAIPTQPSAMKDALQLVIEQLTDTKDPQQRAKLEYSGENLVTNGAPISDALLRACMWSGSERMVRVITARGEPEHVWLHALKGLKELYDLKVSTSLTDAALRQEEAQISDEKRGIRSSVAGQRQALVLGMLDRQNQELEAHRSKALLPEHSIKMLTQGVVAALGAAASTELSIPEAAKAAIGCAPLSLVMQYLECHGSEIAALDYVLKGCHHAELNAALLELMSQLRTMGPDEICTLARRMVLVGANPTAIVLPDEPCALELAVAGRDMALVALLVTESCPEVLRETLEVLLDSLSDARDNNDQEKVRFVEALLLGSLQQLGLEQAFRSAVNHATPSDVESHYRYLKVIAQQLLRWVCERGELAVVQLLLQLGLKVSTRDDPGLVAMLLHGTRLERAHRFHPQLAADQSSISHVSNLPSNNILAQVAAENAGARIPVVKPEVRSLLLAEQLEAVEALIVAGADANAAAESGNPDTLPLCLALEAESIALLRALLAAGARVSEVNWVHLILTRLLSTERGSHRWGFLVQAFDRILEAGAEVSLAGPEGYFPLDLALVLGDGDIVWLLKLAGAKIQSGYPLHAIASEMYSVCSAYDEEEPEAVGSGWRAVAPAMIVLDPKVDTGHPGSLQRQQFAATVARDVANALELPVEDVTVNRVMLPVSHNSTNQLSSSEQTVADLLFSTLGSTGQVSRKEFIALHGGDASGLFSKLQSDRSGIVSEEHWKAFVVALKLSRGEHVLGQFLRHLMRNSRALAAKRQASMACALLSEEQRETANSLFVLLQEGESSLSKKELMAVFGGDPDGILGALGATKIGSPGSAPDFFERLQSDSNDQVQLEHWLAFVASLKAQYGDKPTNLFLWQLNRNARAWGKVPVMAPKHQEEQLQLTAAQEQAARGFFKSFAVGAIEAVYREDLIGLHGGDGDGLLSGLQSAADGTISLKQWLEFLSQVKQRHGDAVLECLVEHLDRNATAELVWRGNGWSSSGRIAAIFDPDAVSTPEDDGVVVELSFKGINHAATNGELYRLKLRMAELARLEQSKLRSGRVSSRLLPSATIQQLVGARTMYLFDMTEMLVTLRASVAAPPLSGTPPPCIAQHTTTLLAASGYGRLTSSVHQLSPNDVNQAMNLLDFWALQDSRLLDIPLAEKLVLQGLETVQAHEQLSPEVLQAMLQAAIQAASLPVVQKLIALGVDPRGEFLHQALHNMRSVPEQVFQQIASALLEAGADPNTSTVDGTPLQLALTGSLRQPVSSPESREVALHTDTSSMLLKSGAAFSTDDVTQTLEELIAVAGHDQLRKAALEDTIAQMVVRGVDLERVEVEGRSLLDWALALHSIPIVRAAFEAEKSTTSAFGRDGEHAVVFEPFVALFLTLLDGDSSPFAEDFSRQSDTAPLEFALEIAELFLNAGVAVLHILLSHSSAPEGTCVRVLEAMATRPHLVDLGLREAHGERPALLHLAARHDMGLLIRKICELGGQDAPVTSVFRGVNTEAQDDAGRTPLYIAAAEGAQSAVQALVDCGAHVSTSAVRQVVFNQSLSAETAAMISERLVRQAVEDPGFDVSANMVWRQMVEHPQPKSNLRLEVAMVELSDIILEVLQQLHSQDTDPTERSRLEAAAEGLVVSGAAVSVPILEQSIQCRAVGLVEVLARRADAAEVWRVAIEALINLVTAVEGSHDSRTRLEMMRAELAAELQRAEETLTGTRQELAFKMLKQRQQSLSNDIATIPTYEDLEVLGNLAVACFKGATEPRLPPLRLADAEERLECMLYESALRAGKEARKPGVLNTKTRAVQFAPESEWLTEAAEMGSYPEFPSEVDMAARYLAKARLRRLAVADDLKCDVLDLACRYSRLVYHYTINVYEEGQDTEEDVVTKAAERATELLRFVSKGCEANNLDNCLLEMLKRLLHGESAQELAFCGAALSALLAEGADPTTAVGDSVLSAIDLAINKPDQKLLLQLVMDASPLQRLGCQQRAVDYLVERLEQAHSGGEAAALANLEALEAQKPAVTEELERAERALKRAEFRSSDLNKSWRPSPIRQVAVREALTQAQEAYKEAKHAAQVHGLALAEAQSVSDMKAGAALLIEEVLVTVLRSAQLQIDPAYRPGAAQRQRTSFSDAAQALQNRKSSGFALEVFSEMQNQLAEVGELRPEDGLQGQSLLRRACLAGETELIASLLARGVSAASTVGLLASYVAATNERKLVVSSPLEAAQISDDQLVTCKLLIEGGASVNSASDAASAMIPLHAAIQSNNSDLMHLLIQEGATMQGVSVLHLVLVRMLGTPRGFQQWEFLQDTLDTLLKAGASPIEPGLPEHCGVAHYLPLDLACVLGDRDVVWLLKLAGASPRDAGYPLHAVLSELYVPKVDPTMHAQPMVALMQAKSVAKKISDRVHGSQNTGSKLAGALRAGSAAEQDKGNTGKGSWSAAFHSLAPRMASPPKRAETPRRAEQARPTINMDVDASRMTILCAKMGQFAIGQRPSLPIGGLSLSEWQHEIGGVLEQAVEEEGFFTIEFQIEPRAVQLPDSPNNKAKPFEMRHIEIINESGSVVTYQGQVSTEAGAQEAARLLRRQRRAYLESTALQLISEGATPETPPNAEHTVLVLAIMAGLADIAQKIVDMAGQKMNAADTLSLMSLSAPPSMNYLSVAEVDQIEDMQTNNSVVDQLVSHIVMDTNLSKKDNQEIMECAIANGSSKVVSAMAAHGVLPEKYRGLHVALPGLQRAQKFAQVMRSNGVPEESVNYWKDQYLSVVETLLESGEDPEYRYSGTTPMNLVLTMDSDVHKLKAMAALIDKGAYFDPSMFEQVMKEFELCDPAAPMGQQLQTVLKTMIEQGVDYTLAKSAAGLGLLQVAVQKGSLPIVYAVFCREQGRFEAASSDVERAVLVEPFVQLFLGLAMEELSAFAIDLDHDGVDTQGEFAVALGDVLTSVGEPVLHLLFEHAISKGKDPEGVLTNLLQCLPDSAFSLDLALRHGEQQSTLLHLAARDGCGELAKCMHRIAMIEHGTMARGLDLEAPDAFGRTPLRTAIDNDHPEMVAVLAEMGAHIADELAIAATLAGSTVMLGVLLDAGCNADAEGVFGCRPLHCCAQSTDQAQGIALATLLLGAQPGADLEAVDVDGATPLTAALKAQQWDLADLLLSQGSDPLFTDCHGVTPLVWAIKSEASDDMVSRLADGVAAERLQSDESLIIAALEYNSDLLFGRCFTEQTTDGQIKLYQGRPLMWWAAYFNRPERARLTAARGAASYVDAGGRTLLHWLSFWCTSWQTEGVRTVLAACTDDDERRLLLETRDAQGDTPLHAAVRTGNMVIAHALLVAFDGSLPDEQRKELVALADSLGAKEMAIMLADPQSHQAPDAAGWIRMKPRSIETALEDPTRMFEDPSFEASIKSLIGPEATIQTELSSVEWIRAPELCIAPVSVMSSPIDRFSMQPGALGSPWFWCAVCALEESTIKSFFDGPAAQPNGCYTLRIPSGNADGKTLQVVIDDRIPCVAGRPAYGRVGADSEMWSLLLSKAIAKAHGSYSAVFDLPEPQEITHLSNNLDHGDPILRRSLAPALSLSHLLCLGVLDPGVGAPGAPEESIGRQVTFAKELAGCLAEVEAGATKSHSSTTHVLDVPTFELRPVERCMLTIVVSGLVGVSPDFVVEVLGADGSEVAHMAAGQEGGMHVKALLEPHAAPFKMCLLSSDEELLDAVDVEFECDSKIDIQLLEPSDAEAAE